MQPACSHKVSSVEATLSGNVFLFLVGGTSTRAPLPPSSAALALAERVAAELPEGPAPEQEQKIPKRHQQLLAVPSLAQRPGNHAARKHDGEKHGARRQRQALPGRSAFRAPRRVAARQVEALRDCIAEAIVLCVVDDGGRGEIERMAVAGERGMHNAFKKAIAKTIAHLIQCSALVRSV